jgi:hypothetical protein
MSMQKISPERMARVLDALDDWWLAHARPPTLRELTTAMGLRAWSSVSDALAEARRRGLLYDDGTPPWVAAALAQPAAQALMRAERAKRAAELRR